jgi:hypothetical protein
MSSPPSDLLAEMVPLPVMQLRQWAPVDEPWHLCWGLMPISLFLGAVYYAAGAWVVLAAVAALAIALWRLWVPMRFELDARGVQQIVLGRRSFRPWSDFVRYEVDPDGVCLIPDGREYPLVRATGVNIVSKRDHVKLVHLVATYLGETQCHESGSSVAAIADGT